MTDAKTLFRSFLPASVDDSFLTSKEFQQALQVAKNGKKAGYERLEFLGDRVVGLVVAQLLYQHFPKAQEGEMAQRFVALVRAETLAEVALTLKLDMLLDTNEEALRRNISVLSDVCEAVLAALYLKCGLSVVQEFMTPLWMPLLEKSPTDLKDGKSLLQEYAQHHGFALPVYRLVGQNGSAHQPLFTIEVCMGPHHMQAQGSNKKSAEQKAAHLLLDKLKEKHDA